RPVGDPVEPSAARSGPVSPHSTIKSVLSQFAAEPIGVEEPLHDHFVIGMNRELSPPICAAGELPVGVKGTSGLDHRIARHPWRMQRYMVGLLEGQFGNRFLSDLLPLG